tara:strand:- start:2323 stop:2508 length:186 start_codon:yes stop_codon:yes gene_type:complete
MGEAKRRKNLGLPPRENKIIKDNNQDIGKVNVILNKYPWSPYIIGLIVLVILIIDLFNYYS